MLVRELSRKVSSLILSVIMIIGGLSIAMPYTIPEAEALEPFLGEVRFAGYNFAPRGWASCDGQILPINQHQALFSLLGTTYGGDGRTTFGIPDMRGTFLMHPGNGPGLTPRPIGASGGTHEITLTLAQLPSHTHSVTGTATTSDIFVSNSANTAFPVDNSIGLSFARTFSNQLPMAEMNSDSFSFNENSLSAGTSTPVNNMPPYLAVQCSIAIQGVFPSRN